MTSYAQGSTPVLTVTWTDENGLAADVNGLQIAISQAVNGASVVASTSTGVTHVTTGAYAYSWVIGGSQAVGDYKVAWTATNNAGQAIETDVTVTVVASTDLSVTVTDCVAYIGADAAARWTTDGGTTYPQIANALAVEAEIQAAKVTYPAGGSSAALNEALKRRVQRNLAMRPLPLSIVQDGGDGTPVRLGGVDPEVRRLEAPYRRRVVG